MRCIWEGDRFDRRGAFEFEGSFPEPVYANTSGSHLLMTFAFDESHPLFLPVSGMVEDQFRDARTLPSLRVHQSDEMYHHSIAACPTPEFGTMAYFRAGLQILDALRQTATWHEKPLTELDRILDFAAGYGRSTRFLAALLPPERIWAAEILPDAVDFQRAEYGISSLQSQEDPAGFRCDEEFDLIFVSSLFSHLPERRWGAWLERLHGLLAPLGVLVFSVHDESLIAARHEMPQNGLLFFPKNEADSWDVADYGRTYVSEAFVSRTIKERLSCNSYVRLAKSLCFDQDLYMVRRDGRVSNSRNFFRGPYGQVEEFSLANIRNRTYRATGWAIDMDGGAAPQVLMKMGSDPCVTVTPTLDRSDLNDTFRLGTGEGLVAKGWAASFQFSARVFRPTTALTVAAKSPGSGKEFVLDLIPYQGRLSATRAAHRGREVLDLAKAAFRVQRKFGWTKTLALARARWARAKAR
jgi:SAM-dependent methyltransferase